MYLPYHGMTLTNMLLGFSSASKTSDLRHIADKALVRACRAGGAPYVHFVPAQALSACIFGGCSPGLWEYFPVLWGVFPVFGVFSPFLSNQLPQAIQVLEDNCLLSLHVFVK